MQLAPSPPGSVTLGQAGWALMFVALYVGAATGLIILLQVTGLVELTLTLLLPVALGGATLAAVLALYVHLIRRNSLRPADLGFRRPTMRLFHLLWQIPATMFAGAILQILVLLALTGLDLTAEPPDSALDDIATLPASLVVLCVVLIAVITPLWEEILFRGALLEGLSRRFRPWVAVVLSALVFASVHLVPLSFAYLFTLGVSLALLRRFHRNLWAPVLLHAANNAFVVSVVLLST